MDVIFFNISAPPEKVVKVTDDSSGHRFENVVFKEEGALDIENPKIMLKVNDEIFKRVRITVDVTYEDGTVDSKTFRDYRKIP